MPDREAQEGTDQDGGEMHRDKVDGGPQYLPPGDDTITRTGKVSRLAVTPNMRFSFTGRRNTIKLFERNSTINHLMSKAEVDNPIPRHKEPFSLFILHVSEWAEPLGSALEWPQQGSDL